ncbi:hypothetical protein H072_4963 [Dactylellina haptotyla CBS 200.50]|uniref:Aminoglycoside phosphotransferase domain-containing protein n=1 Tax=Dactylellina haptotyla (strain CBS 200.50) TaxID=1284197 RepID=S8ADX0_DACHA|nr:hypothetical protein H072_4963 [Dactylellina haptotyla CBS 200.50]
MASNPVEGSSNDIVMEDSSLDDRTKQYKVSKAWVDNAPPVDDYQMISAWLTAVEPTDEKETTEADLFPSDTASMTSTNYYNQESFQKYQPKLFKLLAGIVPRDVSIDRVGRMKGGGNNRTASISLDWPAGKKFKVNGKLGFNARPEDSEVRAVFRASRWPIKGREDPDILDNYAILTILSARGLKVPNVLAYDSTSNNTVCVPYMLLQRISGIRLEEIYPSLTQKQKERVAMLVAQMLLTFDQVKSDVTGPLKGAENGIPIKFGFQEEQPRNFSVIIANFVIGRNNKYTVQYSNHPHTLMKRLFHCWAEGRGSNKSTHPYVSQAYVYCFKMLSDVLDAMRARGFFDKNCRENIALHHPDFYARNIIIGASCRRPDNLTFEIEGVIDWDDTTFLPEVLRSSPCAWLWELGGPTASHVPAWEEWYGDSDELPAGRFDFRLNPDELAIKAKFDRAMGEKRCGLMYKNEYIWIRRLWKFALNGIYLGNETDLVRFRNFMFRWGEYADATNKFFADSKAKYKNVFEPGILDAAHDLMVQQDAALNAADTKDRVPLRSKVASKDQLN